VICPRQTFYSKNVSAIESEIARRLLVWDKLRTSSTWPEVSTGEVQDLQIYAGQAGIFRDKPNTSSLASEGVTVSMKNTAGNYEDETSGELMIYSYPKTNRAPSHDAGEIASLKHAMTLQIPVFVISPGTRNRVKVQLGWITHCEDSARACLVHLDEPPEAGFNPLSSLEETFHAQVKRNLTVKQVRAIERDKGFKFAALARYQNTCVVTDVQVERMLDAAHVIPVANNGTDHVLNSLLLNAATHRAFDSHLWSIHPDSFKIATRSNGPTLDQMKITRMDLLHLKKKPHQETLEYRWKAFEKANKGGILMPA
jgi:putative restriction endonuclease